MKTTTPTNTTNKVLDMLEKWYHWNDKEKAFITAFKDMFGMMAMDILLETSSSASPTMKMIIDNNALGLKSGYLAFNCYRKHWSGILTWIIMQPTVHYFNSNTGNESSTRNTNNNRTNSKKNHNIRNYTKTALSFMQKKLSTPC